MVTLARLGPSLGVALVAFVLARSTLLPGVSFWDTAELQAVGPLMGTAHPTGFPTYVLLGWLASVVLQPFGEPAFRMNLLSALSIAVAAGVLVDLVRVLTGSRLVGVVAGLGLAITPVVWATGSRAEAHSLHLALVVVLLRLLVEWESRRAAGDDRADRWLVAAAIAFGLAAGNHSLTLLLAPPVGLFVLAVHPGIVRHPRLVIACAAALVVTLSVLYLELPLRAGPFRAPLVYGRPETWDGFWYIVLAEQFRGSVVDPFGDLGGKLGTLVGRTVSEFGGLAALIPLGFAATLVRRPRYALLSGVAVVLTVFFAASYQNAAIERYYLGPVLMAWTWLGILVVAVAEGLVRVWRGRTAGRRLSYGSSTGTRTAATVIATALVVVLVAPGVPDRQARVDASDDDLAARWLDAVLEEVGRDAVIISWWSFSTPLWYGQLVEGRRPDIEIVDDRTRLDRELGSIRDVIEANLDARPVYIIRPASEWRSLEEDYVIDEIQLPVPDSLGHVTSRRAGTS